MDASQIQTIEKQLDDLIIKEDYTLVEALIEHFYHAKLYRKIESIYLRILEHHPNDAHTLNNLAVLYSDHLKEFDQARHYYEQTLNLDTNEPFVHFNYGALVEFNYQEYALAKAHYLKAIDLNPLYVDAYLNLSWLYLERFHDLDAAYQIIEQAVEHNDNWELFAHLAYIDFNYRREYDEALKNCEFALELSPKNSLVLTYMGRIYISKKHYDKAYAYFKRALATKKYNHILIFEYCKLLIGYYRDFDEAIHVLKDASAYFKDHALYPCYLSNLYLMMSHVDEAKTYLKIAEEKEIKNQDALLLIGYLKVILEQDTEDAMMYFEKVVEMNPNNLNALSVVGFYNLFKQHHIEKALEYFEKIIELGVEFYPAYFITAQIYSDYYKDYKRALEYYQMIDEDKLQKEDRAYLFYAIGDLFMKGFQDKQVALDYFEKSYETHPTKQTEQIINSIYETDKTLVN